MSLDDIMDSGDRSPASSGVSLDELFTQPKAPADQPSAPPSQPQSGVSLDHLFSGPAQPGAPTTAQDQPKSGWDQAQDAISQIDSQMSAKHPLYSPENLAKGYAQAIPSAFIGSKIPTLNAILMAPMGWIQRATTSATTQAAAILGVPGAKELNQRINPEGNLAQNIPSDITDFVLDKAGNSLSSQPGSVASFVRSAIQSPVTKFGVGSLANYFLDFNRLYNFNQLTADAESLQKFGDTSPASQKRNLITVRAPLTDKTASIPLDPVVNAISQVPGVKPLANIIRAFSPNTGNPDIDRQMAINAQLGYGQESAIKQGYLLPEAKKNYTPEEKSLMTALGENSPNLRPNVSDSIIDAAGGKLSATEDQVRAEMEKQLPDLAEKNGVKLVPGRDQTLIDGAINAKKSDSRYLEALVRSGHIDEDNVNDKVLENHMPHVVNPAFDNDDGEKILADLQKKRYVSSADITRQRTLKGSVDEINQYVKDTYGKDEFFLTDPHLATATRELDALRLERNTRVLDTTAKYGVRAGTREGEIAQKAGWKPIDHPDFKEKTVTLWKNDEGVTEVIPRRGATPVGEGTIQTVKHGELLFPREIASKVQYQVNRKSMLNLEGSLGEFGKYLPSIIEGKQYVNQMYRAESFMSEGFWARNTINNASKAIADGTAPRRFYEMGQLLSGKDPKVTSINPETGNPYTLPELKDALVRNGITSTNIFRDGPGDFLNATKQLMFKQVIQNPKLSLQWSAQTATNLMHKMNLFGEYGENLTRGAHFLQGLKDGFHPEDAAMNTNRVLFDYRRNSPVTDAARFFMPFVQHPIKQVLSAPDVVGKNPAYYNFVTNSLPQTLANAFHDPVSQDEINQLLPDSQKLQDVIAGPFLPGNTLLASLLTNPQKPGQLPSLAYFKNSLGLEVINHFDYLTKASRDQRAISNYGLDPFSGAFLKVIQGHDNFGNNFKSASESLNYLLRQGVLGNFPFPNTFKLVKEAFGLIKPTDIGYEPMTLLAMKGMFGQMAGITDLDREAAVKINSLSYMYHKTEQEGLSQLKSISKSLDDPNGYSLFSKSNRMTVPMTNAQIYAEVQQKNGEKQAEINGQLQGAQAAQSALLGKTSAEDYISRLKLIQQEISRINQNYQFAAQRYLQMASGAKSPEEARARAGVKLYQGK